MPDSRHGSRELYLRLLSYVRPHASVFALAVLGMVAAAATEPLFPALMTPLLDGGFASGGKPSLPPLAFAAALIGIFLLRGFFTFASQYCLAWVANRVVLDLRAAMFARLVRFPTRFFDDATSGVLLSRIAYDVAGVTAAATTALTVAVSDSLKVVLLLGLLFFLNWQLTSSATSLCRPTRSIGAWPMTRDGELSYYLLFATI